MLHRLRRGLDYLVSNGVFLHVFDEAHGRAAVFKGVVYVKHALAEVVGKNDAGVILAAAHALSGRVAAVQHDPVDALGCRDLLNGLLTEVAVIVADIVRSDGNADVAGVPVRIPVGVDIKPRIERGYDRYGNDNDEGKEVPRYRSDISGEQFKDIFQVITLIKYLFSILYQIFHNIARTNDLKCTKAAKNHRMPHAQPVILRC